MDQNKEDQIEFATLQGELQEAKLEANAAKEALEAERAANAALLARLEILEASAIAAPAPVTHGPPTYGEAFAVGKKMYAFLLPKFIVPGIGTVDAADAAIDTDLRETMVKDYPTTVVEL
jgi:5-formyltetrahydrofolate cyclo-ligase